MNRALAAASGEPAYRLQARWSQKILRLLVFFAANSLSVAAFGGELPHGQSRSQWRLFEPEETEATEYSGSSAISASSC
jgi:hypothetical protein